MSRRIMASGTRAPDLMVLSALIPANYISSIIEIENEGSNTERGLILDVVTQQIPRADCGELGESLKKSFGLCSLPNTGCTDQNNARCF